MKKYDNRTLTRCRIWFNRPVNLYLYEPYLLPGKDKSMILEIDFIYLGRGGGVQYGSSMLVE